MSFTRRTHIVRIQQPENTVPPGADAAYVDIEVLDAIAYKTTNGHVHVWKCPSSDASPYIKDETGDDPDWSTGGPSSTRGSHAEPILSTAKDDTTKVCDIEVLDRIAFNDENGRIWCLDLPSEKSKPFCVDDGTGDRNSTRRTHLETIKFSFTSGGTGGVAGAWVGPNDPDNDGSTGKIVVERTDMVGFIGADEKKLIIKMESHDDGNGKRADTYCEPQDYDPDKPFGGTKVPTLDASGDPNFYIKFLSKYEEPQPIFSLSGYFVTFDLNAEGQFLHPGETKLFVPGLFNTSAAAAATIAQSEIDFARIIVPGSGSVQFAPPKQIGTTGGGFSTPSLSTGGIGSQDDGSTIKWSMGPLWWIRAVYAGGGVAGDY